jgi:hypothetical protein
VLRDKKVVGVFVRFSCAASTAIRIASFAISLRFFAYLFKELYVSSAEAEVLFLLSQFINRGFQSFSVTLDLLIFGPCF